MSRRSVSDVLDAARAVGVGWDDVTGKTDGENCHGAEKVRRLHEAYPDVEIAEFYSDSRSDSPLAELAEHAYLVHGQTRTPW